MTGENSNGGEAAERALCYLCIWGTVTLGNILLALLSSLPIVGYGLEALGFVADVPKASKLGGACGMFGLLLLAFFYVLDFHTWRGWWSKTAATGSAWVMFSIAAVLTGCLFPWATTVCVLLLMTFMLLAIRRLWQEPVKQPDFAKVIGFAFLAWGLAMLALWYVWVAQDDNSLQELRSRDAAQSVYDFFGVQFYRDGTHCDEKASEQSPSNGTQAVKVTERDVKVQTLCAQANNVMVITWAQPLIAGLVDCATGMFFLVGWCSFLVQTPTEDRTRQDEEPSNQVTEQRNEQLKVQGGTLVVILTLLIGGLYVATYFTEISVNLTMPLLVVLFVGGVVGCAWLYVELDLKKGFQEGMKESEQGNNNGNNRRSSGDANSKSSGAASWIEDVKRSTWIQAMAVGSGFIPTFMVLENLRQMVNEDDAKEDAAGQPEGGAAAAAPGGGRSPGGDGGRGKSAVDNNHAKKGSDWSQAKKDLLVSIKKWHWSDILLKICILGEVFFTLQVLGTKVTYVFLAWLNSRLGDTGLWPVIGIAFGVGFFMFMLPPVPGVPVYIFCGIVVSLQGTDDIGVVGVCLLAITLSLSLKLSACTGQYLIGYFLGQSARVQHLIGIDTPVTQAIRRILDDPEVCLSRVYVLVGGPDWPTSVTCGILRVNVVRMLVGTLPCLFTASPCVLAGVFLADAKAGSEVAWHKAVGSAMTLLAGFVQMGSMLLATTTIWAEVYKEQKGGQDKQAPAIVISPELAQLRREEEVYNDKFRDIQASLDWRFKYVLTPGASLILVTGYSFAGFQSLLFENFSVSGDINDPTDSFGLDGNVLNIVKEPGWVAVGFFCLGVALHAAYLALVGREARRSADGSDSSATDRDRLLPQDVT